MQDPTLPQAIALLGGVEAVMERLEIEAGSSEADEIEGRKPMGIELLGEIARLLETDIAIRQRVVADVGWRRRGIIDWRRYAAAMVA